MRHIRAKFKTPHPAADPYWSHGWDSLWAGKTQERDGDILKHGGVTNVQPILVQADGKCLVLASPRNVAKLKKMIELKQMVLAPGEVLEVDVSADAPAEDAWPEAPELSEDEEVPEAAADPAPAVKRGRKPMSMVGVSPDKE